MNGATPEAMRFARIEALLDAVLDLPESERDAWLETACADDPSLHDEAVRLLDAMARSVGFLENPEDAVPVSDDMSGQRLGPWRLLQPTGQGGTGEVWLAERADGRFEQQVAVKLLHRWREDTSARLEREQALLARLDHPGIARLIDAGAMADGRPYMVMEYIAGRSLIEHCEQGALPLVARLALFLQVCDAVAYAHRHLVVHCDLKPQNILLRPDGRVALLDFGIARLIDVDPRAPTVSGAGIAQLTPWYAAPEQLSGAEPTTSADVYALGLILHELLTGQSPWGSKAGSGGLALLERTLVGPPPAPSTQAGTPSQARQLRGDLDAIVARALQPESDARYASVEALRDDLARHLSRQPVHARGDAFFYRLGCTLRRHWLLAGVSSLLVLSVLAGSFSVMLAQRQTERERDAARTEALRAKGVRDALAHMFRDAGQRSDAAGALTAKQILQQAAARIDAHFSDDPATAAQVLHALGELHLYINDYAAAEPLLRNWLARESLVDDPDMAADVRFALAEALFRMGQAAEAVDLLHAAQSHWQGLPQRHAERLLTSRMLQSQLERQRGEIELGIQTLEASLPQRLQRSGEEDFETAALLTNLGAAYIQAGRIDEGIQTSQRAMRVWRSLHLEAGNDALNTLNNLAAAYFRRGELEQAAAHFEMALAIRRAAFGPSAATAALIGNQARVLQARGDVSAALELIEEAEPMARTHAGDASPLTLSLQVTRAELLLSSGAHAPASEVLDLLEARDDVPALLQLRLALGRTRLLRDSGNLPAASQHFQLVQAMADRLGPQAQSLRTQIEAMAASLR
jgi:serine/threonine protein kinase/tetratricopeptide (TPR) repeat protein